MGQSGHAEVEPSEKPALLPPSRRRSRGAQRVVVAVASPDHMPFVVATARGDSLEIAHAGLAGAANGSESAALADLRPGDRTVIILPRQHYFQRSLALPRSSDEELRRMAALEFEANRPPAIGAAEVSCRRLPDTHDGQAHVEVYAARTQVLGETVARATAAGLNADTLLPTAPIWAELVDGFAVDLMVAQSGGMWYEMAWKNDDGSIAGRSIRLPIEDPGASDAAVAAAMRPLLRGSDKTAEPLSVAWFGDGCPHLTDRRMTISDRTGDLALCSDPAAASGGLLYAELMARGVSRAGAPSRLGPTDLLPNEIRRSRQAAATVRPVVSMTVAALVTLALIIACLHAAVWRMSNRSRDLAAEIARIETEGTAIRSRVEQLHALAEADRSLQRFLTLIDGLHTATPPGVTYNHVELRSDGTVTLRGQAALLSDAFNTPQELQRSDAFDTAVFTDAGQRNQGDSSIAEFRIEATLRRTP